MSRRDWTDDIGEGDVPLSPIGECPRWGFCDAASRLGDLVTVNPCSGSCPGSGRRPAAGAER